MNKNHVHTKKYYENVLVDEFDSLIIIDSLGNINVKIIRDGKITEIVEVYKQDINTDYIKNLSNSSVSFNNIKPTAIVPPDKRSHPYDREYYFVFGSNGHLGFDNLTRASIAGVLNTLVTGGNVVSGSITAIIDFVLTGGWRNVYYEEETYYPYGMDMKGKPIWKSIKRLYAGNDKGILIETLYLNSDLVVQVGTTK